MAVRVGIDSGGTFTDVVGVGGDGVIHTLKVPSTPEDPARGFEEGLRQLLARLKASPAELEIILHGTTVGINAILERRFPSVALITTRGFRDILEIARQTVPGERGSIYHWIKPGRVVPLEQVHEVAERVAADGEVILPLNEVEARRVGRRLGQESVQTVAISLLNSYANPAHEQRLREILREEHPDCYLTTSSETLSEFREYERTLTTCMNALLMPVLSGYLDSLGHRLRRLQVASPLYVMRSAGGVVTAERAASQPLATAFSGPAAAVLGMSWTGREQGYPNLITFDMGGTSTDVSLIEAGRVPIRPEAQIDIHTIRTPTVDVVSIGSGGGSVASLGPGDRVLVGPRSAGAHPGPACYGRGGREPTVTDANLLLGRLPPYLVGGGIELDPGAAEASIAGFGERLGLLPVEAAQGILEIASFNMSDAIRQVSVRRGRDPRDFSLFGLGGAGPLHAAHLARILGIPTVVIPRHPGLGCALGLLVADVRDDFLLTDVHPEGGVDFERLNGSLALLGERARDSLEAQGIPPSQRQVLRRADLRYAGMASELTVAVPDGELGPPEILLLAERFHDAHREQYGYSYGDAQAVEIVNLRVSAVGLLPHLDLAPVAEGGPDAESARTGERLVHFDDRNGFIPCPVYDRSLLEGGNRLKGPAIVEQYDTNTVVHPGQELRVDSAGNLVIYLEGGAP